MEFPKKKPCFIMISKSYTVQIFISKIYNKMTYVYMLPFFP